MLRRAKSNDRDEAIDRCHHLPSWPVQIAAWLHEGGLEDASTESALFIEPGGGLAFVSDLGVVMPHLTRQDSVSELARLVGSRTRVIIGPTWATRTLRSQLSRRGVEARIVRDQVGYAVSGKTFKWPESARSLHLVRAEDDDLDAVVAASAAMAVEESKDDPARRNPRLFRSRIAERLRQGRDFILKEEGGLLFKVNVAALSPQGGHIEGVYTLPSARRRGIGLAGMAWTTRWILQRSSAATLLVNKDNVTARQMYERLGYLPTHDSQTILAR